MEQIDFYGAGLKLVLGILGILLFAAWKVREHLVNFDFAILISKNKPFWGWSVSMIVLVLITVTLSPETSEAVKTMVGLDINGEPSSFLSLGIGLSQLSNSFTKKKLDSKE